MARELKDSFWKTDRKGREVVQAWYSTHFQVVKVGEEVECDGRIFVVEAVGEVFKAADKTNYCYLYPVAPKAAARPAKPEYQDEDVAQFEAEQIRELGRTGELPGA